MSKEADHGSDNGRMRSEWLHDVARGAASGVVAGVIVAVAIAFSNEARLSSIERKGIASETRYVTKLIRTGCTDVAGAGDDHRNAVSHFDTMWKDIDAALDYGGVVHLPFERRRQLRLGSRTWQKLNDDHAKNTDRLYRHAVNAFSNFEADGWSVPEGCPVRQ